MRVQGNWRGRDGLWDFLKGGLQNSLRSFCFWNGLGKVTPRDVIPCFSSLLPCKALTTSNFTLSKIYVKDHLRRMRTLEKEAYTWEYAPNDPCGCLFFTEKNLGKRAFQTNISLSSSLSTLMHWKFIFQHLQSSLSLSAFVTLIRIIVDCWLWMYQSREMFVNVLLRKSWKLYHVILPLIIYICMGQWMLSIGELCFREFLFSNSRSN